MTSVSRQYSFGQLADGSTVVAIELTNRSGMMARVITLGATLQALTAPDRNGQIADVVLGYATAQEYRTKQQYFGVTIGRYANRIAGGTFTLDGHRYRLEANDGPNHLHGGSRGFDLANWTVDSVSHDPIATVVLSHVSPDGDSGYPGTLKTTATYALSDRNELSIEYRATTDKTTIVNMTSHSFFNLGGEASAASILHHRLTIHARHFTPIDATSIPLGEQRAVADTPFDFLRAHTIGARIRDGREAQLRNGRGYDHNYVLDGAEGSLRPAARLEDPTSGRVLDLLTSAPGLQFYSGNFLDGTSIGKSGKFYRQSDGLCLEPQIFPDAPNRSEFPSPRLEPGSVYSNRIALRFSTH